MANNEQIRKKIKRYREIIRQTKRLRREKNEILSWLDSATRWEEYRDEDIATHIDKIDEEIKKKF